MEPSALVSYSFKPGLRAGAFAPASCFRSAHHHRGLKPLHFPFPKSFPTKAKRRRFVALVPSAASEMLDGWSSRSGGGGRRVYRQSQAVRTLPPVPVKEIASFVAPAGAFIPVTFVLWKGVENVLVPKPKHSISGENRSSLPGMKWSFAPGTNLPSGISFKIERESRQKLNEFAKELRSFRSVDVSGRNFGDEGLFCLSESLGYNQSAGEVNFSGNGITAAGLKAFDGILQANTVLKTLNLSGNAIGDEGSKFPVTKNCIRIVNISQNQIIALQIF